MRIPGTIGALILSSSGLFAQGTTSRVLGVITDPTGAAVPGASVRLIREGANTAFTTKTTDIGAYLFEAVQAGSYVLEVEAAGFKKFVSRQNPVTIGQPATINVSLEVGALAEQVEVAASYEAVQTATSGNFGNLFTDRMIRDLPIVGGRGRNPLDLVLLQPGVVSGANTGGGYHVHGARDRSWNFTLDGIDINETSAGGSNFSPLRTNPDSIAEFRVITSNATAEYGRNSGAQVTMVTPMGGNEYHGNLFWFYRTPRLQANEWEYNVTGQAKGKYVQNIFGGTLSGPIVKNKTFFFTNLQWLRGNQSRLATRTVYTAEARKGNLRYVKGGRNQPYGVSGASVDASGNVLPGLNIGVYNVGASDPQHLGLDKTTQALANEAPLPNLFTGGDGLNTANFRFVANEQERQHDDIVKVDHVFNEKNTVFARVAWGQQNTNCDNANGGLPQFPGGNCYVNTTRSPRNPVVSWRFNPTPNITNELTVGQNKFTFNFVSPQGDLDKISLVAPVTTTAAYDWGNLRTLKTWQIVENFSYFQGAHALKFGANLRYQQHVDTRGSIGGQNSTTAANFSTSVNTADPATFGLPSDLNTTYDRPAFQSHINFLLGRIGNVTRGFPAKGDAFVEGLYNFDARFPEYDFFVQDTWKVRKNLTVDLGLRWEMKLSPNDADGKMLHPNQVVAAGAAPSTTLQWVKGSLFKSAWHNIGPSIGMAWDPTGNGTTSLRGNYRMAFDRLATFVLSSSIFPNLPGATYGADLTDYGQSGGRLAGLQKMAAPSIQPSAFTQPPAFGSSTMTVVDPNLKVPTTHMWGLSIQHEIARKTVVEINYIGRRAYHLFGAYDANQVDIFRNGFVAAFNTVKAGGESNLLNQWFSKDSRLNSGETVSRMIRRLYLSDLNLNSAAAVASALAKRLQGGRSVSDLSGAGPFVMLSYPQYGGGMRVIDSNDFSTYHALEIQVERRLSSSARFQLSYTWSKSLDTRSFDPIFTTVGGANNQYASSTPWDILNRKLNYAISDFDRPHVVQGNWTYELPFGNGKRLASSLPGVLDRVLGGWEISGMMQATSGRPMTVYAGSYTFSNVVQTPANCSGCDRSLGQVHEENGLVWYINPDERAKFSTPIAGEFGNTGRNFFRGPRWFNIDAALLKNIKVDERRYFQLRGDFTNLTNTPSFGFPTLTATSSTFGRIYNTVSSYSRKVQVGAKFYF